MAKRKHTRKNAFPEIVGKVVKAVEIMPGESGFSIGIMFEDRTFFSFDVEPFITIFPELSDWKSKNYKPLKRWRTVSSR